MPATKIDRAQLRDQYLVQKKSMIQIAEWFSVSRIAVWKALRAEGIELERDRKSVNFKCDNCGKEVHEGMASWKKSRRHYCSDSCYFQALSNPDFVAWRQGQRIARKVVSRFFKLSEGNVVHHEDSNQRNNRVRNLWVFATQADHMAYERGVGIQPIWKGESVPANQGRAVEREIFWGP